MYKIAIIGGKNRLADRLSTYIKEYADNKSVTVSVRHYFDGSVMLADYFEPFDIIIVCLEGDGASGMDFAAKFRKIDMAASVILASADVKHAIGGYEVGACAFLHIPVERESFFAAMDRAADSECVKKQDAVMLKCANSIVNIRTVAVYYIESSAHYLTYHTESGDYIVREFMRVAERDLAKYGFVRINHGYLVNLEYVTAIRGEVAVVNGTELKISRARKPEFVKRLEMFTLKRQNAVIFGKKNNGAGGV